ncbi:MAG: DUF4364 family protein [Eubacteriales bacterium]|nr:DUF4364 family protein [Eubacteriales bacterium]
MLENRLRKLVVLYILNEVNLPLSNTTISELMVGEYYSPYFQLQESITELVESHLLRVIQKKLETLYEITKDGQVTLDFFAEDIPEKVKATVKAYLKENMIEIRQENEISADYYPNKAGGFYTHLIAKNNKQILIELTLLMADEGSAIQLCNRWRENYALIYKQLLSSL